jgi:hypothetical protein
MITILLHCFANRMQRVFYDIRCYQWRTQEFCSGGGGSTNSVEDRGQRERGSGGGSPLVRDSGGSCNLVQGISFHSKIFSIFSTLRLFMMPTNLFVIANVKQLRT